jgi:AAA15 family ATPase/GTPase
MAGEAGPVSTSVLLSFRAENVRSFRDPLEFSLQATALAEEDVPREVPWREDGRHPIRVLPAAGVFGANASGKTNLLRVMDDMRRIVLTSFRSVDPSGRIPRRPFRLDPGSERAASRFEVDLVLNGIRYEYGFVLDDTHVISEWARRYPRGRAATLFQRSGDDMEFGESNRSKGRAVAEIVRPNALYLSAAAAASHPDLLPLYEWFGSNLVLAEASSRESRWAYTTQLLKEDFSRERVLALLRAADLGITNAHVRKLDPQMLDRVRRAMRILTDQEDESESTDPAAETSIAGIVLSHRGTQGSIDLDSGDESLGTLVWLGLAGPLVSALAGGNVLLADELEASLHPKLVAQLVRLFQDPASNPNGAQLIFNSHEVSLLGDSVNDRVLGRDQVWFTEKLHDGSTRLFPLTDLNPRKDEAVSLRYFAGRYGASPIVDQAEFAELAALIAAGNPR